MRGGRHHGVSNERPALDSAATTIQDLVTRVANTAERFEAAGDEATASDLYDVERSLRAAARRLGLVVRRLDR